MSLDGLKFFPSDSGDSNALGNFRGNGVEILPEVAAEILRGSPWFSFPNKIANASILQILGQEIDPLRNLHILDIGFSHGVQWPTLLEALTRRSSGLPPLVRITMVTTAIEGSIDQILEPPFSIGPPGDNFASRLLCFSKSMNINLQINHLESRPLQNLNPQVISKDGEEILVIRTQFRLNHLNHNNPDERSEFLRVLRSQEPKG
ncbi:Protein NODULATION SIGNALING PATHWAY 1 [Linum perenne]